MTLRELWRRGQHGWPASYPVAQLPNAPLIVAVGADLVAAATSGSAHAAAKAVAPLAFAIWAYEEITDGANAFRRVLGAAVLVLTAVHLAQALD